MVVIAPFRGILYDPERIGGFADIVAPPYDAITAQHQEELYARDPHNIVRLILAREGPCERHADRYERAQFDYDRWRADGILRRDPVPALYPYEQEFALEDGIIARRLGFLTAARLEDFDSGRVLPHERTLSGPKADRMRLMETCQANFCPIFSLYSEPEGNIQALLQAATRGPAVIAFSDAAGVIHRLWRITDPGTVAAICRAMAPRVLYIADGHHRYETALAYRDARRAAGGGRGDEPYEYILMFIASLDAPGITVLPFHRLLSGLANFQPQQLLRRLEAQFRVEPWPAADRRAALPALLDALREQGRAEHAFALGFPGEDRFYRIGVSRAQAAAAPGGQAEVVKQLDVSVLHELILRDLLRVRTESLKQQRHVTYIPSARKTLEVLEQQPSQLAFWLNPTRIDEVRAVAQAREVMPQKSTYFYPKPITGLVIHPLDVPEPIQPPLAIAGND